ncbi:hypothetical protein NMY3_00581 [Candidatus Nitrosocosmicus oleophilus]|uniref:Uncharacterized protein n=1 Tax=Candidatus Nitrosocosmicus oleophilus TaxID=1353260 RepID=A0A654LX31_9ARCH|nr:hypothetical protein NMY3_00581 [Candidatus Nitrosocosmicus oleophilus]
MDSLNRRTTNVSFIIILITIEIIIKLLVQIKSNPLIYYPLMKKTSTTQRKEKLKLFQRILNLTYQKLLNKVPQIN